MSIKQSTVKYVKLNHYKRVIVMSDIHGDKDGFIAVLNKVNFTEEDALIIVGDILERGAQSLELLKTIIQYSEKGNLYMVAGNNDVILSEWYTDEITNEDMHWYVNSRRKSIIIEMAEQLNMPYQKMEDIRGLKIAIREKFDKEISFLWKLPHIIESEMATFVHAGIKPGNVDAQDRDYCLSVPAFATQTYHFDKPVIVGHWPASNYCDEIINVNPYFNKDTNVISIDGGNSMKSWQQINYLIFSNGKIQSGYYDNLPKVKALDNQEETEKPLTLSFPNTLIEIRQELHEASVCYVPHLNKELFIANDCIYVYKGKTYCSDFTTYNLSIEMGEILSYCKKTKDGILVKRNGIVGNYNGRYELLNEK